MTSHSNSGSASDRAARALRRVLRRPRPTPPTGDFATRLRHVEEDLRGVRTRVNALFFTVLTVAFGELMTRVFVG